MPKYLNTRVSTDYPELHFIADMVGVLVLDFDGTMTDAEVEGRPYRQGCLEDLAVLCGKQAWRIKEGGEGGRGGRAGGGGGGI